MPGSLAASQSAIKIINKYSLSNSQADLTRNFDENAANNDFASLDYFGFYHPDGLTKRDQDVEHKYRKKDVKRVTKWLKFIDSGGFSTFHEGRPNEELIRRVFKGIPPRIRTRVWPILLNVDSAKVHGVYEDMRKFAFSSSSYIEQIDLDINRTFRSTAFFNESHGPRQQVLFRILAAYSVYNSEVGYCQGMSDIAGMLLIYIADEEAAFWALAQLLNGSRHTMHPLFSKGFPGLQRYFTHHERVLRTHLERLWRHFKKSDVDTCTYAFKWYMQCFLGRLPISLTMRIWDIYLLEGEKALVAMAYNILKMHKRKLLRMDQMQIFTFLQDEISRDFGFDDDDVIDSLKDCFEDLRRTQLETPPPLCIMLLPDSQRTNQPSSVWEVRESVIQPKRVAPSTSHAPEMLPTNIGQAPTIWEARHSDNVDNKIPVEQAVPETKATSRQRNPQHNQTVTSDPVSQRKHVLESDTPVVPTNYNKRISTSSEAPTTVERRRRQLRGSKQSCNSDSPNRPPFTKKPFPNGAADSPSRIRNPELSGKHFSGESKLLQSGSQEPSTPRRISTENVSKTPSQHNNPRSLTESEKNVWFIPPGTRYHSIVSSDRKVKTKKDTHVGDLPSRDYAMPAQSEGLVKSAETADNSIPLDSDSPWYNNPASKTPAKTRQVDTSKQSRKYNSGRPSPTVVATKYIANDVFLAPPASPTQGSSLWIKKNHPHEPTQGTVHHVIYASHKDTHTITPVQSAKSSLLSPVFYTAAFHSGSHGAGRDYDEWRCFGTTRATTPLASGLNPNLFQTPLLSTAAAAAVDMTPVVPTSR